MNKSGFWQLKFLKHIYYLLDKWNWQMLSKYWSIPDSNPHGTDIFTKS